MIPVAPDGGLACIPVVPFVGCSVSSLGGDVARSAATAAADGLLNAFTAYLSAADSWLVGHLAGLFDASPELRGNWFGGAYRAMMRAFEAVVTPMLLVATIGAIIRQDLSRLGRIWAVGLPVAAIAAGATTVLADLGLRATDSLTSIVVGTHLNLHGALLNLSADSVATGAPALVAMGIFLLALVGGVLVWLELVLRSAAIYVAVFFMPLALATFIWPAAAAIAKRSVQVLVALVLSKFVIFATVWLGMSVLGGDNSIDGVLEGAGILLLAAFAPFALLKLVPVVEVGAIAHLDGIARRPFRAASRAAAVGAAPSHPVVQRILAARGTSESSKPEASPVEAQPLPTRMPDYRVPARGGTDG
jgi:hypothetical protein